MPAVSVCDTLAVTIRHNLDTAGQSKSPDDLNLNLTSSANRLLRDELVFEETDHYKSSVQDRLKSKCILLKAPKPETTDNGKLKDLPTCSKNLEKSKEPRLPEPAVVLYAPDKVNLGWNKSFPIGAGMCNVGNTCYLNSTLQALFHVPALVNWLLSDAHHESKCEQNDGAGECLTCAVAKTLQFSHQKSGEAIKPFFVYSKLKLICRTMVPGQQEDAHEFLRYLLEGMEKAYLARHKAQKLDSYSKETTPINQIFGGYIRTEVKCLQCRHVSTTFQHFQDLLLDIRKANTLDEALSGYFSQEQLDNNDYKCEACKRRVPATKQFILERPPKVLCVQLKRFSVLGGKISRHVGFKPTIDMGPYIRRKPGEPHNKLIYRLTSMVTHMGPSVNCGHYTAIAQVSSGKFYCFDDSSVRQISLNNAVSTNAYIMIFEMEPPSSSSTTNCQTQGNQLVGSKSSDVPSMSKSNLSFPNSNGLSSKLLDGNVSKSLNSPNKNAESGSSSSKPKDRNNCSGAPTPPPPPPPPLLSSSNNARRNFIGPQLPPHMQKNSLHDPSKNGKLVDYDGDSSDEEDKDNTSKLYHEDRENGSSKPAKINGNAHSYTSSNHNGNSYHSLSNSCGVNGNGTNDHLSSSSSNSSGSSPRGTSPKNGSSNGKGDFRNGSSDKCRDKWHHKSTEQKVYTKASPGINSNKGWLVCQESSLPSSATVANGWNESRNGSKKFHRNFRAPNAAESRNSHISDRPDNTPYLQKQSQWGYGNGGNVQTWEGGKARVERDVDNQRRMDRKRPFDNDDDELDRGRSKKMKMHNNYKDRNETKYNQFQQIHNNRNSWPNDHYRNNNQYRRQRHGSNGNYNRNHNPNHNYSRNWRNWDS